MLVCLFGSEPSVAVIAIQYPREFLVVDARDQETGKVSGSLTFKRLGVVGEAYADDVPPVVFYEEVPPSGSHATPSTASQQQENQDNA